MRQFYQSFILDLVFIAMITVGCMISMRFLVSNHIKSPQNTPVFTSQEFQFSHSSSKE